MEIPPLLYIITPTYWCSNPPVTVAGHDPKKRLSSQKLYDAQLMFFVSD